MVAGEVGTMVAGEVGTMVAGEVGTVVSVPPLCRYPLTLVVADPRCCSGSAGLRPHA